MHARQQGWTGTVEEYNRMAMELPQHTRVAFLVIREAPHHYDPVRFGGPWPEGGVIVVKLRYPPTYSSWRNSANWRTGESFLDLLGSYALTF